MNLAKIPLISSKKTENFIQTQETETIFVTCSICYEQYVITFIANKLYINTLRNAYTCNLCYEKRFH